MVNLREKVEADLSFTLEGAWALPVILIDPDGNTVDTKAGSTDALVGQILYDTVTMNPETGEQVVVNDPIVVLRRTSLSRVPVAGETWFIKIPTTPNASATPADFIIDPTRPPEGGASIGFIRLYLRKAAQA